MIWIIYRPRPAYPTSNPPHPFTNVEAMAHKQEIVLI
jgi:hypothetical protein